MAHVKFGWRIPAFPVDGSRRSGFTQQITDTLSRIEGQFDSAWVSDHFFPWASFVSEDGDNLECWTALSYLAACYPNLNFGSIVVCQSYRNPALLAKMAATLQLLSGGRFILGLGAGWFEREYHAYGYEYPSTAIRLDQLEEAVQIIRSLWAETPATFQGQYYRIENAYCEPKPDPKLPIMIGGGGEKRTLRITAQYADWWNLFWCDAAAYAQKLKVLEKHCQAVGRDFNAIVKTYTGDVVAVAETEAEAQQMAQRSNFATKIENQLFVGTPDQVAQQLREFTEVGVEHFILRFADFPDTAGIELFAEQVIPQFD